MAFLRPPAPPDADRCERSWGPLRCKNRRIRGKPFCRNHLALSPSPQKKRKRRAKNKSPNSKPAINRSRVMVRALDPTHGLPSNQEAILDEGSSRVPEPGQIWVVLHESDCLPRAYVRIERITRSTAEVTPLEFHPVSGEEFQWAQKGLPISCGTFRAQKSTAVKESCLLLHRIGFEDDRRILGMGPIYRIFPKEGEIWAIYRDCRQSERSPLFRFVEVLLGYTEEEGVTAAGLVAVEGSKGVFFRRELFEGFDLVRRFSRRELLLFSHRIRNATVVHGEGDFEFS